MIAALSTWHDQYEPAARALKSISALPAHVVIEAYSVLTRLPAGLALTSTTAAALLVRRFDAPALQLDDAAHAGLLERLGHAGVFGGASYDGLVALEADAHGQELLTLDRRAQSTYQRLGVAFSVING